MGTLPMHLRLFVAFSVLFSLVLLPIAWVFLEYSTPIIESNWAQNEAWVLARLQQKVDQASQSSKKELLLAQAHLIHGQVRWVGDDGGVLISTKEGAMPMQQFPAWPSQADFINWVKNHSDPVGAGYPPKVSTYLIRDAQRRVQHLIFKMPLAQNEMTHGTLLLRLAIPAELRAEWQPGIRNGLAIAISLAMLVSLFWMIRVEGPRKRLKTYLDDLRQGELGASMPMGLYGLRAVGETVADLAFDIRQKVAGAHEPSVVLEQFIEALPLAVVIWDGYGELLGANGLARRLMGFHYPEGKDQVKSLVQDPQIASQILKAEAEASPVEVEINLTHPLEQKVWGHIHVLKRPQEKAFVVFVSYDFLANPPRFLTADDRVVPVKFYKLWRRVSRLAMPLLKRTNNTILMPDKLPEELVAEVQGRLFWAMAIVLVTCAATLRDQSIQMDVQAHRHAIGVTFGFVLEKQVAKLLKIILAPVGGRVELENEEVMLWLPRA